MLNKEMLKDIERKYITFFEYGMISFLMFKYISKRDNTSIEKSISKETLTLLLIFTIFPKRKQKLLHIVIHAC